MTWKESLRHAVWCFRLGKESAGEAFIYSAEPDIPREPHMLHHIEEYRAAMDRSDFLQVADIIEYKLM